MRLAASQMAWKLEDMVEACTRLRRHCFSGVEILPTKCWPNWEGATVAAAKQMRRMLGSEGMVVPALQSLTYGVSGLKLFGDDRARSLLRDHLIRVADLAQGLGAGIMVMGAPAIRDRGELSPATAFDQAVEFFRQLAPEMHARKVTLCLENVPASFGCNFVSSVAEAVRLVGAVARQGFGLQIDAAGMLASGENSLELAEVGRFCDHFHASEPGLAPLPHQVHHKAMAAALFVAGYDGWVSLEMAEQSGGIDALDQSLTEVATSYGKMRTR